MIIIDFKCEKCGKLNTSDILNNLVFNFITSKSKETQEHRRTESIVVDCKKCGETYEIILRGEIELANSQNS